MANIKDLYALVGRRLENAFFFRRDKELKEQLEVLRKMEETKDNFKKISGIENDAVLQKLVELNIPPQIVASLAAIPLIEVAWADATVGPKERESILENVELKNEIERELLESWLKHKPEPHLLAAWTAYIQGVCATLSEEEKKSFKKSLLARVYQVANSEDGFWGIGEKISTEEKMVIKKLEDAFCSSCQIGPE